MADILPYLGVEQTYEEGDPAGKTWIMEDLSGLTEAEACTIIKDQGLEWMIIGSEERVTAQIPAAGQPVSGNGQVILYLGEALPEETVTVPDFSGMNRQQASDTALSLGLSILVTGNTDLTGTVVVTDQSEAKDTRVPVGTTITLRFTDTKAAD